MTIARSLNLWRIYAAVLLSACLPAISHAQSLLDRPLTLHTKAIPLSQALDSIAAHGHFQFSYNSNILPEDSLVKLNLEKQPIRAAMESLLGKGYDYSEQGEYLIILRGPPQTATTDRLYELSGYIRDQSTTKPIANATVYVKEQLLSVLTDAQGHFKIKLRVRSPYPILSVSKEWFADTDIVVHAGYDQVLQITLTPVAGTVLDPVYISSPVERTWLGRRMLSARQRVQSLNLSRFFTSSPAQVSLVPWVGTHGRLGSQVTNTYSLNLIGGYSAGVRGIEIGGVFNIDKKDVNNVQLAGVLNLVGGNTKGFQGAGIINYVLGSSSGLQLAGYANHTSGQVHGVQLATYGNVCKDTLHGVQLSAFVNKARYMAGVQIGLINFADTSTGLSIGLLSFVKHGGAHQLALSVSPITGLTAEYRMGSQKLNSIFLLGYDPWSIQRPLFYGYGMGKAFPLGKAWSIYTEISEQEALGTTNKFAFLGTIEKISPLLTYRISKTVNIFAGPSLSLYTFQPKKKVEDQTTLQLPDQFFMKSLNGRHPAIWAGLTAGISIL